MAEERYQIRVRFGKDVERMGETRCHKSPKLKFSGLSCTPPRQFPQIAGIPRMCANVWEPWKRQATIGWF